MGRAAKRRAQRATSKTRVRDRPAREPVIAPVAAGLAGLLALACLVPLTRPGQQYPQAATWYWAWGSIGLAALGILVFWIRSPVVEELPRRLRAILMRPAPAVFAAIAALTAATLAATFAFYAFRGGATTSDEIAQLWQSRILLTGRLSLPPDPNPEFFALETVVDSGRWYAQFPIGGPMALAPGVWIGAPWIVNPIVLAVAVIALYRFARRAFGEMQGRAVVALFAVTPMVLFMAGTRMNHVSVLCLATIALAALVEWDSSMTTRRRLGSAAVAGLALGVMATVRPLDAVIVAVPIGVFQLWVIRRDWRRLRELAIQAACGVLGAAPVLYANAATTGSPFRFGYQVLWGSGHQIGFRVDPYGKVHTLSRALDYAVRYISELNMSLVAWPIPALVILIAGLFAYRRTTRWDVLLIALFVVQLCAYASYNFYGTLLGPRFLYTALPTLVVILARTPFVVGERFGGALQRSTLVVLLACGLVSWSGPWLDYSVFWLARDTRNSRQGLKLDIAGAVRSANIHNAVVFLHEPFGERLLRRLWGLGMSRSDAAKLLDSADVCSLVAAVAAAESDTTMPPSRRAGLVRQAAVPFVQSRDAMQGGTPRIRVSSRANITPGCRAEIAIDRERSTVPFGPALLLEPIGADGRLGGDIIYAADLRDHNEVLRKRFGDRRWYRLTTTRAPDGSRQPLITPY
jgi:hypothetical protein